MNPEKVIREQLVDLLKGGNAHMSFSDAVSRFPLKEINRRLPNASYTVWHLLEHMRIAQWDILEFARNPGHISPEFPVGYWPREDERATAGQWRKTIKGFLNDLKAMRKLVKDPETDIFSPISHAKEYSIFLEVLTLADHNAYHVGELVTLRRVLNMKPVKEY
jgi:hypothetical protein